MKLEFLYLKVTSFNYFENVNCLNILKLNGTIINNVVFYICDFKIKMEVLLLFGDVLHTNFKNCSLSNRNLYFPVL